MTRRCEHCGAANDTGFRLCGSCLDAEEARAVRDEREAEEFARAARALWGLPP